MTSCGDHYSAGQTADGFYLLDVPEAGDHDTANNPGKAKIWCGFSTMGGPWALVYRKTCETNTACEFETTDAHLHGQPVDPTYVADAAQGYLQKYSDAMIKKMRGSAPNNLAIRIQYDGVYRKTGYHHRSCPFKSDYHKPTPSSTYPSSPWYCNMATCRGPYDQNYTSGSSTMGGTLNMNFDLGSHISCFNSDCCPASSQNCDYNYGMPVDPDACGHAWGWPKIVLKPGSHVGSQGSEYCYVSNPDQHMHSLCLGTLTSLEWWVFNDKFLSWA